MFASDYNALKQYLETPPVTVVSSDTFWAATLLREDVEWPAPTNQGSTIDLLSRLPRRQQVLCAVIAAESVLDGFVAERPVNHEPRDAVALARRWLARGRVGGRRLHRAGEAAARVAGEAAYYAALASAHAEGEATEYAALAAARAAAATADEDEDAWLYDAGDDVAHPAGEDTYDGMGVAAYDDDYSEYADVVLDDAMVPACRVYYRRWWSACRRALCFADVATAEIEVRPPRWVDVYETSDPELDNSEDA